jgi:hypothetical protein
LAHLLCYARTATAGEVERALDYLDRYRGDAQSSGLESEAAQRDAWTSYARILLSANEFVYLD